MIELADFNDLSIDFTPSTSICRYGLIVCSIEAELGAHNAGVTS